MIIFFKASTVTSAQPSTASQKPSDQSKYIILILYNCMLMGLVPTCSLVLGVIEPRPFFNFDRGRRVARATNLCEAWNFIHIFYSLYGHQYTTKYYSFAKTFRWKWLEYIFILLQSAVLVSSFLVFRNIVWF